MLFDRQLSGKRRRLRNKLSFRPFPNERVHLLLLPRLCRHHPRQLVQLVTLVPHTNSPISLTQRGQGGWVGGELYPSFIRRLESGVRLANLPGMIDLILDTYS